MGKKRLTLAAVEQIADRSQELVRCDHFESPDQLDHLLALLADHGLSLSETVHAGLIAQGNFDGPFAKLRSSTSWPRSVTTLNWERIVDELLGGDHLLSWLERSLLRIYRRRPSLRSEELAQVGEIVARHMRVGKDVPKAPRRADPRQLDLPI